LWIQASVQYQWGDAKNAANIAKHGISFATASRIFEGPVLTAIDGRSDYGEIRERSVGAVEGILFLTVVHTDRGGVCRIISARRPTAWKEDVMKKPYDKELSIEQLAALKDEDIDFSDIPEADDAFWKDARVIFPDRAKTPLNVRLDADVVEWFKAQGKGYQTRINAVLRSFYEAHRAPPSDRA
jgi:uncharacterized DUF497 family protein